MEATALAPLDALETALNALVTSLTTSHSFTTAPSATKDLLTADDALTSALATLHRHQENYGRILTLRAEATGLQDQLKNIIRTCGQLRGQIGAIHPSILEGSDSDEDEDEASVQDVDYNMLLSFAARIGKHNAAAAREAEAESVRRKMAAKDSKPIINGKNDHTTDSQAVEIPEESQNDLNMLNYQVASDRAAKGMAFPDAPTLRLGVLGQLQLIRENEGEEAVDKHVEWMIRGAEHGDTEAVQEAMQPASGVVKQQVPATSMAQARPQVSQQHPVVKAAPKKVKLDMWEESDSE